VGINWLKDLILKDSLNFLPRFLMNTNYFHYCVLFICQELGIRNYFHRKKLQLALQAISTETRSPVAELDHNWVTSKYKDLLESVIFGLKEG